MVKTALIAALLVAGLGPAAAEPTERAQAASAVSAQARRVPPRLRVYPGGRPLYRDCDFRLVQQFRPGGPVIVPWQRCWWVRG
jgi:hypothetical protein